MSVVLSNCFHFLSGPPKQTPAKHSKTSTCWRQNETISVTKTQPAEVLSSTFNLFLLGKFHSSAATLWRYLTHCYMDDKSSAYHPQRKSLHLACRHIQLFCSQGGAFCKIRFHPFLPGSTSFKAFLSRSSEENVKQIGRWSCYF